jgi:hypothetical protein
MPRMNAMYEKWKLTVSQSEIQGALVPRSRAGVHVHVRDTHDNYSHASDRQVCILAQWSSDSQDGMFVLEHVAGMEED